MLPRVLSWIAPYAIGLVVLFCAAYVLNKGVPAFLNPPDPNQPKDKAEILTIFAESLGIMSLLAGVTVMTRIPRLTHVWGWRLLGAVVFLVSLLGFRASHCWAGSAGGDQSLAGCFWTPPAMTGIEPIFVLAALGVVLAATIAGALFPKLGMKALLVSGAAAVAAIVIHYYNPDAHGALWPVLVAGALFLYLWWLAALLFDLTFVWHRYIRMSVPLFKMEKELRMRQREEKRRERAASRKEARKKVPKDSEKSRRTAA